MDPPQQQAAPKREEQLSEGENLQPASNHNNDNENKQQQLVEDEPQSIPRNQWEEQRDPMAGGNPELSKVEEDDQENTFSAQNQLTINQDTVNQILTVHLEPGHSIWHRGEIIVSNRPPPNAQRNPEWDLGLILEYIKFLWSPPSKITNTERTLAYYCLRKRGGGGKILYLNKSIYHCNFLFDYKKLLTVNYGPDHYDISNYAKVPKLFSLKFKNGITPQNFMMTLQANSGNVILEKSLGEGQKFYVRLENLLAISEDVEAKREISNVCLTGPGYVFVESDSQSSNRFQQNQNNMMRIFLALFFGVFLALLS